MAVIPKLAGLVLVGVLTGCSSSSPGGSSSTAPPATARAGLGSASPAAVPSPVVSSVTEAYFASPSKNISCVLTVGSVRCDIVRRNWAPPAKPSSCEVDWGQGMYLEKGKAGFVCAGDTVVGSAKMVLPYGTSLRAGTVQCDSGNAALRCIDQSTQHGFTLAVENYNLF